MREFSQPSLRTPQEKEEFIQETYAPIETVVGKTIESLTSEDPTQWLKSAYRCLRKLQNVAQTNEYPPEVREYLSENLEPILEVLRGEFSLSPTDAPEERLKQANERARSVIHEISDLLLQEKKEHEPIEILRRSLDDILEQELSNGYQLRKSEGPDGIENIEVYSPLREKWFAFPLPPTVQMVHKGGFPRVILKLLSGAEPSTIESELPPNDYDVIAWGEESQAYKAAAEIGVDLSGVEVLKDDEPDFPELMHTRDLDLNCAFIGQDGLVYSEAAETSSRTGHIEPIPSSRGLYGTNMFCYQGEMLYSGRDIMRAIKFVAEGKALSFSFKELNRQVDMGIYALVLAEKILRKPERKVQLEKMFLLLEQTGQVREGEKDIWATLDRLHAEYPFVQMEDKGLPSDTEVSAWLLKKLGKQALKRFRSDYRIPSTMELDRSENDTAQHTVSLSGYSPTLTENPTEDLDELVRFLDRCSERNKKSVEPALTDTEPKKIQ
jgi:hypothetical protein